MQKKKNLVLVALVVGIWLAPIAIGVADVNYDFVKKEGDAESKLGPMVEKILSVIAGLGIGLSLISIGVGACQFFGRVFKMDKDTGAEKIKAGGIGVLVFLSFWAVIATIFAIGGK